MKALRHLVALGAALVLGGCSGLPSLTGAHPSSVPPDSGAAAPVSDAPLDAVGCIDWSYSYSRALRERALTTLADEIPRL
ncbi:MAG: hypothetical protein ACRD1T_08150, partial [Acidimicrobiia bacterium]